MMKPTAFLINTARGAVLWSRICTRHVRIKPLQVRDWMPSERSGGSCQPLLTLDNVIIYPHIGGNTMGSAQGVLFCHGRTESMRKEPTWPINDIDYVTAPTSQIQT